MSFADSFLSFPFSFAAANIVFTIFAVATPLFVLCALMVGRK